MSVITDVSSATKTAATTTSTGTSSATSMVSKDAFLKILMSQLKYQDPMDPMKADQFMSQLAQLTQVEELQNISQTLAEMKAAADSGNITQWLNVIGKKVNVDGNTISKGDDVELKPAADYDTIILTLKGVKDGNTTQVTFNKGDTLTNTYNGEDDVKVSAVAVKGGKVVSCTASVYRTVTGVQSGDKGLVAVASNGDQYAVSAIKKIKN
ncbi:MAG: hypothetical protein C0399_00290 [Syntrophus sp. (in: bacteria)]|nr:hypothetical protein [Syntrophus sp. (in: bacteria)]